MKKLFLMLVLVLAPLTSIKAETKPSNIDKVVASHVVTRAALITSHNVAEFDTIIKASKTHDQAVIVKFYAHWCGSCNVIAKTFNELSNQYGQKAVFVNVNIDTQRALLKRYGIHSIPTFMVFKNGQPIQVTDRKGKLTTKLVDPDKHLLRKTIAVVVK